jgi:hypothetical protein
MHALGEESTGAEGGVALAGGGGQGGGGGGGGQGAAGAGVAVPPAVRALLRAGWDAEPQRRPAFAVVAAALRTWKEGAFGGAS